MSTVTRREPIFNAPLGVILALGVLIGVHVIREFLPDRWDEVLIETLAFIPSRLFHDVAGLPGGILVRYGQLFSHALLHADYLHLAMNCAWLLAVGTIIARRIGAVRMLVLGLGATAAGALLFALFNAEPRASVIGASGGISGLMGAAIRLIHAAQVVGDPRALRTHIERLPCLPLSAALVDRNVIVSTVAFIGLNIAVAFGLGSGLSASGIAWQSHVGGYLFGLLAFGLFDREPRRLDVAGANAPNTTLH